MKWLILALVVILVLLGLWYYSSQKAKEEATTIEYGLVATSPALAAAALSMPTLRTVKDLGMN